MRGPRGQVQTSSDPGRYPRDASTRRAADRPLGTADLPLTGVRGGARFDSQYARRIDGRTAAEHQRVMQALRIVRDDDVAARERLWALREATNTRARLTMTSPS